MDWINTRDRIKESFTKYKYVLLILAIGVIFMIIPESTPSKPIQESCPSVEKLSPEKDLEEVLGQIAGVGKVKVLLTESSGPETIYQTDEDSTFSKDSDSLRVETVIVTNSNREEVGLIRSVTSPVYMGAIIVCQGGDNPTIKLCVVQAVSSVTGISSDRITVLKMK